VKTNILTVALIAATTLIGASTASAQADDPCMGDQAAEHVHNDCEMLEASTYDGEAGLCSTPHTRVVCVCNDGYTPHGELANGDPDCRRRASGGGGSGSASSSSGGEIYPSICVGDAVPHGSSCECPDALDTDGHDADNDGLQEVYRVTVRWDRRERRAMGVGARGDIQTCLPNSYALRSEDEVADAARDQRIAFLEEMVFGVLCGSTDYATASVDEIREDCVAAAAARGGIDTDSGVIIFGDGTQTTLGEFAQNMVDRLADLGNRVTALEDWREDTVDPTLANHEARLDALEALSRSFHLRVGAYGLLGGLLSGPMTGAGGASLELIFRWGDLPVGSYVNGMFGGQSTGWNVGESFHLAGGAGFVFFTGGRADTTISLGYFAETLLDPFMDGPGEVDGDSLGVLHGGILSASFPLPGDAHVVRIEPALIVGGADRRFIDDQAIFRSTFDASVSGMLRIVIQPDWN
jgi:hypothetical protein